MNRVPETVNRKGDLLANHSLKSGWLRQTVLALPFQFPVNGSRLTRQCELNPFAILTHVDSWLANWKSASEGRV